MRSKTLTKGAWIAKLLWPELELEVESSFWDKYGIDGYLNGETVQIKYDGRIAISNNLYLEIFEKSKNNPSQEWRKSPGIATEYIFTTEDSRYWRGYHVNVDKLAIVSTNLRLTLIKPNNSQPTSLGFIIPLQNIKTELRLQQKEY